MRHVNNVKTQIKVVFLLFVFNAFAFNILQAANTPRQDDSLALVAIYNATNGPGWSNTTQKWKTGPISGWYGVKLNSSNTRVSKIDIPNLNLQGTIPDSIGNLTALTYLALNNNQLTGVIPNSINNLSALTYLAVNNNQLYGSIPSGIKNFTALKAFAIKYNYFNFTDIANSGIAPTARFIYAPQYPLPVPTMIINGNEITLSVNDRQSGNIYQWCYSDGTIIPGMSSFSYTFTPTTAQSIKVKITNSTYTILGNNFNNLILETTPIDIEPVQQPMVFIVNNPDAVCAPYSINLTSPEITLGSTEGLTFNYFTDALLTNSISPQEASNISISGTYYITSSNGTEVSEAKPVVVTIHPKPELISEITAVTCLGGNDGGIDLTVSSGKVPYTYSWSNGSSTEDLSSLTSGTYDISVTDSNGCEAFSSYKVEQNDFNFPTAVTQDITVQLDINGVATISAAQIDNGSSDACGIASMEVFPATFNPGNVGVNTVTLTVTDNNGNISTATAFVTVEDKIAPTAVAQDITVQLDINGVATITADQIDNGSSDACGIASIDVFPTNFNPGNVGANTVTLTVTDNNGNISTATALITVEDKIAPTAVAQDITIQLDINGVATITADQIDNGSSDACGIASIEVFPATFNPGNVGANTVTLTVTDNNGNVSTATSIVTVEDKIAPIAVAKEGITVQLDANGTATIIANQIDNGSSDACGIASMEVFPATFNPGNVGANTVTLTVTDNNGNVSTATSIVTVEDKIAPTAVARDITVQLDINGVATITTDQIDNGSSDACGIASMKVSPSSFDCNNVGANMVTLTVTDIADNFSTASSTVTVEDKIAPSIIAPPPISKTKQLKNCGGGDGDGSGGIAIDLGIPVVSDNCTIKKVTNNAPSLFQTGLTVVTWTVTDVNGNSSSAKQNVTVIDNGGTTNKVPVIISITSNSPVYILNTASVTGQFTDDNLKTATWYWGDGSTSAGSLSGQQIKGSHKYKRTGMYDVTLTIKDAYGKTASKVYSYIVVFDNACGDVTGGGWINSEKGDYRLKSICEKANFGFNAQYDKQMNLKGNLTFQMNCAKFYVKSTKLEWLLINDDHAIFKGKATVNNVQGYEFMVSAVDIDVHKSCGGNNYTDLLRIIVWNSQGNIIYDNQYGDQIETRPTDKIGSGSIVIHKGKSICDNNYKSLDLDDSPAEVINPELFANLKVYPNPASKVLYVEIPERREQAVSFDIVDVTGRIVSSNVNLELYGQNSFINLDSYQMKPGFYILKLKEIDGTQSSWFRFMKQ
jgi:hypothetical protein